MASHEFQKGDRVEGRTTAGSYHGDDVAVSGWYLCPMAGNPSASMISFEEGGEADACVSTSSLRLVRKRGESEGKPQPGEEWEAYDNYNEVVRCVIVSLGGAGAVVTFPNHPKLGDNTTGWGCLLPGERSQNNRQLIRKASLRSPPSPPSEGEFYGTMPAELPKTLPTGAKSKFGYDAAGRHLSMRLGQHSYSQYADGTGTWCAADEVNWTTVRRLTPAASPERKVSKPCSHCDNPNCHSHRFPIDPYREHAAAVARHDPAIEQVAAARLAREARYERRKAETVEDFGRPLATVAVGGRFGRRVPLPGRWALAEDDEP